MTSDRRVVGEAGFAGELDRPGRDGQGHVGHGRGPVQGAAEGIEDDRILGARDRPCSGLQMEGNIFRDLHACGARR